jgi:integrase/recombinase XerD
MSLLGRSPRTFDNYSRHVSAIALHYGCLPTELDKEQIEDYLYMLQKQSKTPSQTYFKHTVYGLRFLLKSEGLTYDYLHLPSIGKSKKLPTVLSHEEMWKMLQKPKLLKHRILLAMLYGCGLRCMEVRGLRLCDVDLDRKQIHVVQSKGKKDRYLPLADNLVRGLRTYIEVEKPKDYLFNGKEISNTEGVANYKYSQRGVQWVVSTIAKEAGIQKEVSTHTLRHTYACHLLEAGMNIVTLQHLMGHASIETTMEYLHIAQLDDRKIFSPLDNLFSQCGNKRK